LKHNRPKLQVVNADIRTIRGRDFGEVDLVSAGVPCPPFSIAGKQLGASDERDLFPEAIRIIREASPLAVMLENVPGLASAKFKSYRLALLKKLRRLGYEPGCSVLQASEFGVSQRRPRFIVVGIRKELAPHFSWPLPQLAPPTVGEKLLDLMAANGWQGAKNWKRRANAIAPTIVGGSHKHGGPDLGPTRARAAWRELGVDGLGIANEAPGPDFPRDGLPRLTTRMVARLQSFPDTWIFSGNKTRAYRQVGNAFPPLVAAAVAGAIHAALTRTAPLYDPGEELFSTALVCER
jgi:DNA (cytosine-5)-methyltransferase 1